MVRLATIAAACLPLSAAAVDSLRPLFQAHCVRCHGPEARVAGLDFTAISTDDQILKQRRVFARAVDLVRHREMPPAQPQPSEEDREKIAAGIEAVLKSGHSGKPSPGSVTMPRLNRVEYDNTIRDLTGLDLRPAAAFPADPPGESGFDNDREALFLPPLLLEKYLSAANLVVDELMKSSRERPAFEKRLEVETMRNTETQARPKPYGIDIQAVQNTIYEYVTFPSSGTYRFRVTAWGSHEGRGRIPGVSLRIDNELRGQSVVPATEKSPGEYSFDTFVRSGSHRVSMHFFALPTSAPEYNTSADKKATGPGRAVLSLDRLDIGDAAGARDRESGSRVFTARPGKSAGEQQAVRKVLAGFAERAWRRPVENAELARLMETFGQTRRRGEDYDASLGMALKAVLVSPNFIYRVEGTPKPGGEYRLNGFEIASRLSYYLWLSMPDAESMDLARKGKMRDPRVLEAQVKRMIADPRSRAFVDNFFPQWLGYSELGKTVGPDRKTFPVWTDGLKEAMIAEPALFFADLLRTDSSLLNTLSAGHAWVNEELAKLYGIEGVHGREMRRVELAGDRRGGVLGMASVLTATSLPVRTSPVVRGKWLLETLLDEELPPPPANVGDLPDASGDLSKATLRQRFEQHRKKPQCASCHNRIDPLGYGLENFDAVGRWREKDNGQPVDAEGVLRGGEKFRGPAELKKILLGRQDVFARSVSARMLSFALGRKLDYRDDPVVDRLAKDLAAADFKPSALLTGIARSAPFLMKEARP